MMCNTWIEMVAVVIMWNLSLKIKKDDFWGPETLKKMQRHLGKSYIFYLLLVKEWHSSSVSGIRRITQMIPLFRDNSYLHDCKFHHCFCIQLYNSGFLDSQDSPFLLILNKHAFTTLFEFHFTFLSFYWLQSIPIRQLHFSRSDPYCHLFPKATARVEITIYTIM